MKSLLLVTYLLYGFDNEITATYLDKYLQKQGKPLNIMKDKTKPAVDRINALMFLTATIYSKLISSEVGFNLKGKSNQTSGIDKYDVGLLFYGTDKDKTKLLAKLRDCIPSDIMEVLKTDLAEAYPLIGMKTMIDDEVASIFNTVILQAIISGQQIQYDTKDTDALLKDRAKQNIDMRDAAKDLLKIKTIMEQYKDTFAQEYADKKAKREADRKAEMAAPVISLPAAASATTISAKSTTVAINTEKSKEKTKDNTTVDKRSKTEIKEDKKRKRSENAATTENTVSSKFPKTSENAFKPQTQEEIDALLAAQLAAQKALETERIVNAILRARKMERLLNDGIAPPKIPVSWKPKVQPTQAQSKPAIVKTEVVWQPKQHLLEAQKKIEEPKIIISAEDLKRVMLERKRQRAYQKMLDSDD